MGLDMYAYFVSKENAISDEKCRLVYGQDENFYWRKNYNLHHWMEKLWEKRTGNTDSSKFNCVKIRLYKVDIENLEKAINSWKIDDSEPYDAKKYTTRDKVFDLKFCKEAKEVIDEGYAIYYDSWW